MIGSTVYYERRIGIMGSTETVKGTIIALNGKRCVVRSRESYVDTSMIFNMTRYRDVERVVDEKDVFVENADFTNGKVNYDAKNNGVSRTFQDERNKIRALYGGRLNGMTDVQLFKLTLKLIIILLATGINPTEKAYTELARKIAKGDLK